MSIPYPNPCELCLIKVICTVLCMEKIEQITNKIVERKKLKNPNFSKRGGILLSDFIEELIKEGRKSFWYDEKVEVRDGFIVVR
jgi:hypothetical protein